MLPYLYTLAHEAHRTGAPLFRPLFYDFPDDPATFHRHDQVMVGPHLMVAPIYHPGNEYRMVYLPGGIWYDYWSSKRFEGPTQLTVHAPLGRIPLFARGGAVLPLGNERGSTMEPLGELTLEVFPAAEGGGHWIEDDGTSMEYEEGIVAETSATMREEAGHLLFRLAARSGPYEPHPRTLKIRIHACEQPIKVSLDGETSEQWTWDGQRKVVELAWQDVGQAHEVLLEH